MNNNTGSNVGNDGNAAPNGAVASGAPANQSQAQYRAQLLAQQRAALAMAQQSPAVPVAQQQQGQAGSPQPPRSMPRPGQNLGQAGAGGTSQGAAVPAGANPNPVVLQMLSQNPAVLTQFLQSARDKNQLNEQQIGAVRQYLTMHQVQQQQNVAANGGRPISQMPGQQQMSSPVPKPALPTIPQQQPGQQQPRPSGQQQVAAPSPQVRSRPPSQQQIQQQQQQQASGSSQQPQPSFTPEQQRILGQVYSAFGPVTKNLKDLEVRLVNASQPAEKEALQAQFAQEQSTHRDLVQKFVQLKNEFTKQAAVQQQQQQQQQQRSGVPSAGQQQQQQPPPQIQPHGQAQPQPKSHSTTDRAQAQQQQQQRAQGAAGPFPTSQSTATVTTSDSSATGQQEAAGIAPGSSAGSSMLVDKAHQSQGSVPPQSTTTQNPSQQQVAPSSASLSAPSYLPNSTISPNLPLQLPQPYPNAQGPRPTLSMGLSAGAGSAAIGTPGILAQPTQSNGSSFGSGLLGAGPAEEVTQLPGSTMNGKAGGSGSVGHATSSGSANAASESGSSTAAASGGGPVTAVTPSSHRLLTKRKISEILGEVDPSELLEPDVEDLLLDVADEFIDSVTHFACRLAKHRKGDRLESKDVQVCLERMWNIRVPGSGMPIPPVRVRPGQAGKGGGSSSGGGGGGAAATVN